MSILWPFYRPTSNKPTALRSTHIHTAAVVVKMHTDTFFCHRDIHFALFSRQLYNYQEARDTNNIYYIGIYIVN